MKEFDINTVWDSDRSQAQEHYNSLKNVEKLARKKSDNILNKIRRNIVVESIFSVLLIVFPAISFYQWHPLLFWGFIVLTGGVSILSARIIIDYVIRMRHVNHKDVLHALQDYVKLTGYYIRRTKILINYVVPVGYMAGLVLASFAGRHGDSLQDMLLRIGLGAAIGLPFMLLLIGFANRKYIKWVYGKHYQALKEILENLKNGEQEEK